MTQWGSTSEFAATGRALMVTRAARDRRDRRRSPEDAESNEVVKKDVQARVRKMDLCGAIYIDGWGDEVMCILPAPCVRHSPEDVRERLERSPTSTT
jgi:hypothetical protein